MHLFIGRVHQVPVQQALLLEVRDHGRDVLGFGPGGLH